MIHHPAGDFEPQIPHPAADQVASIGPPQKRRFRRGRPPPLEAGSVPLALADHELIFAVRLADLFHQECSGFVGRNLRVKIHDAAPKIRVFDSNHSAEAPQRRLR